MFIGAFLPFTGGLIGVLDQAHYLRIQAFGLYARNPRRTSPRRLGRESLKEFLKVKQERNYHVYLITPRSYNPASQSEGTRAATNRGLREDWRLAERLGAEGLIMRPGAHTGDGFEQGKERFCREMDAFLTHEPSARIYLENSVGAGSEMGSTIEELASLLEPFPPDRVMACINIAHLHLAGYDIVTDSGWLNVCDDIEQFIGWQRVGLIILTDTSSSRGSRREQLTNIGEGYIGQRGLRNLGLFEPFWEVPKLVRAPTMKLMTIRYNLMTARLCL